MKSILVGGAALATLGCMGPLQMTPVKDTGAIAVAPNDQRFVVAFKDECAPGEAQCKERYHFCVEPVGPVARLQNINFGGNIGTAGTVGLKGTGQGEGSSPDKSGKGENKGSGSAGFDYATGTKIDAAVYGAATQSLARIYEVSEIMQLAHAMSFRLCEARAGGQMNDSDYVKSLSAVFQKTSDIMYVTAMRDAAMALPALAERAAKAGDLEKTLVRDCGLLKDELESLGAGSRGEGLCRGVATGVHRAPPPAPPTDTTRKPPQAAPPPDPARIDAVIEKMKDLGDQQRSIEDEKQRLEGVTDFLRTAGTDPQAKPARAEGPAARAAAAERSAIEALLANDVEGAIGWLKAVDQAYPTYHAASEIRTLLGRMSEADRKDPAKITEAIRTIVTKYLWGMPDDLADKLRERAK
ncbi:MAG: hypothetical protein U0359_34710 [Byssovorax sp.]